MSSFFNALRSRVWMPLLLFVLSSTLTMILWKVLVNTEQQRMELETQVTGEQVKLRLEAWFDTRGSVVAQFAEDLSQTPMPGGADFTTRAERIIQLYPGFQALNFIDENWVIRVVVPLESNRPALGKDLHDHPSPGVREAIAYALEKRTVHRSPLIQLLQGGPGFALYAPIFRADGSSAGFVNGVFGVDELVNSCLSEQNLRESFNIRLVTPDQRVAYHNFPGEFSHGKGIVVSLPVRIVDRDWELEITLARKGLARVDTRADKFLAAIGFSLSFLLAVLLWAYQVRQAELDEKREQYRLLVENQADFMVKVDRDLQMVFVSPSFCRFLGRGEQDLLGADFLGLVFEDDLSGSRETLHQLTRKNSGPVEAEFRLNTSRGALWTGWSGSSFRDLKGRADGFILVGREITQRRELESQLRLSQRLQAVGQLAGGIAHDFNNILQAIQGYIEFVMEDLPAEAEARQDLEQARIASERAAVLVRQLLAFSRRQILKPVNLDLNQVIAGMMSMLVRVIGPTIPIEFHPQEDLGLVKADLGQLEQILMNLAVNARDAMESGGRITITTGNEYLDEDFCRRNMGKTAGHYVRLDLADTGTGMDQELLDKIFEPFFTTKEGGAGTGLGLATVYGIVKQHEGMILVQSEPGHGSCFTIYLPLVEGVLHQEPGSPKEMESPGNETVLFAEDEILLRKLGVRILRSAGYQVLVAGDGQEAWELYLENESRVDVAVLDVVMPRLDGRELAERIRERDPDLGVIFVSGYDSDSARGRRPPLVNSVRISKPYARYDLLEILRKVLEGSNHD